MSTSNRLERRRYKASARNEIAKSKAFVLVFLDKRNRVFTITDTAALSGFKEDDPLRVHFVKMRNNVSEGAVAINLLHAKYMRQEQEAEKAMEFKKKRSEELKK